MKTLNIYIMFLFATALFVQCSREDDKDLYQVFYKSAENFEFDESKFKVTPLSIGTRITDSDTVRFEYEDESIVETYNWVVTLTHYVIKGTSLTGDTINAINTFQVPFTATSLDPSEHFWTIGDAGEVEFTAKDSMNVSLSLVGTDTEVQGSTIKFNK